MVATASTGTATQSNNPHTYHSFYINPANDDYDSNYVDVMRLFCTTINPQSPTAHDNLHNQLFGMADAQIHAYLLLIQELNQEPYVTTLHCQNCYVPHMGSGETA